MSRCDQDGCSEEATHTVEIDFPEGNRETWIVCRLHDRLLKIDIVRSRPKATPQGQDPTVALVRCGECQEPLEEASDVRAEARIPCPKCGSQARLFSVTFTATMTVRSSVQARSKETGKGGWQQETKAGANFTRDLEAWGSRELAIDRRDDRYQEIIELYDGTQIISTAQLSEHQDSRE